MKIITLWQPWASLIALQLKQYETRSWGTSYRGKLAIHAAKRPIKSQECAGVMKIASNDQRLRKALCNISDNPNYGCVVAITDLIDCLPMLPACNLDSKEFACISEQTPLELAVGLWQPDRYAWKLENVIELPQSIPHKGEQGLKIASNELQQLLGDLFA